MNILPVALYPAGVYTVPETSISDALTHLRISVPFCTTATPTIWPNASDTVEFDLAISVNGGAPDPWNSPAKSSGGIHPVPKNGTEIPAMYVEGDLPPGVNRKFSGSVTLVSATGIRTSLDITVS